MPNFDPLAGWMWFGRLDGARGLTGAATIAWKITDVGGDPWTDRLVRFKTKNPAAIAAAGAVAAAALPPLVRALGLPPQDVAAVCALSSGATAAGAGLPMLSVAQKAVAAAGIRPAFDALTKAAHQPIHGLYHAAEREAELDKANYVAGRIGARAVLVFDDLITRGSTLSRVAAAIHADEPGALVIGVALGKTERQSWRPDINNAHVPAAWDGLWQQAEAAANNNANQPPQPGAAA